MYIIVYFAAVVAATTLAVSMLPSKAKKSLGKATALVAVVVLFTVLFGGLFYGALAEEEDVVEGYYPLTAVVVDLDYDEDVLILEDGAELVWEFEGIEDFEIGDIVSLLMWDNNTPDSIYDDVILLVYYSGFSIDREEVE